MLELSMNEKAKNFWIGIIVVMGGMISIALGLAFIPDDATITSAIGLLGIGAGGYFAYKNK